MIKKIGITGQSGFIGSHIFNSFSLKKNEFVLIPFKDEYFEDEEILSGWVKQCDVIIHLAAMNRHKDEDVIFNTNLNLVKKLIAALEKTGSKPQVIFSSSSQEERNNAYGKSKHEGRLLLSQWSDKNNAKFTGMIIPNVFGPFGLPHYNSVIATFCYELTHNGKPFIDIDGSIKFIYVNELVNEIDKIIVKEISESEYRIPFTSENRVSEILSILNNFKCTYLDNGIIPVLKNSFEINLFNTFRSFIDLNQFFPFILKKNTDERGSFIEVLRLGIGGQVSYSTTKPNIVRGNHFHTRKIERFIVIKGKAEITLRKIGTNEQLKYILNGDAPSFVDMPVWYTHNIKNIGNDELYTMFWINEFYNPEDPDTFFEEV